MTCAKAHMMKVGECPYCRIAELEARVKELLEQNKEHARFVFIDHARICDQLAAHQAAIKVATAALEACDGFLRGLPSLGMYGLAITEQSGDALAKIKEIVK